MRALEGEQTPRPPGRFVEVDGLRVHYIVKGKGRPVQGNRAKEWVTKP